MCSVCLINKNLVTQKSGSLQHKIFYFLEKGNLSLMLNILANKKEHQNQDMHCMYIYVRYLCTTV